MNSSVSESTAWPATARQLLLCPAHSPAQMPRVDVWDIPEDKPSEPIWIGYKQGLTEKYELRRKLGEGGFGSVRVVALKSSGAEFACKSICKRLDVPNLPPIKQQQHLENIKREVGTCGLAAAAAACAG